MKFTQFLKQKGPIGAIFMGVFYAIAMLGIFLPGYTAIPGNIDKLPIAIINDDAGEYGAKIANQLEESLPFKEIETNVTNKQALKELEKNDLALVVHIPETFSADMQKGEVSSSIDFTMNEAGATTVSSTMNSVVKQINDQLSSQFSQQTAQGVLMDVHVPEEQAAALAKKIDTAYVGNVVAINEMPEGMNNNMLPMFLSMAGYVGAMIGAMQLVGAFKANRNKASRRRLFTYMQVTALLIAVVSSALAAGIAFLVNDLGSNALFNLMGQQIINYMVFFNFTAIFMFLLGDFGMIVNLPILFIQTLANGSVIPREMMHLPYEWASYISPMYYSVQAYFANLYGSISASPFIWSLLAVGAAALIINIVLVAFIHKPVAEEVVETASKAEKAPTSREVTV
ncbi:YhgE/Pip domain-containing protein [Virgibacillus halodenitrificans]|uniref:YhgE/Pip domain-containing protein n=1 Tax=Virgibacillus halodenitrificans TaxID=1482 RepID=UPI001F1B0DEE|nr:ABC transporter permease [Virgibacillus halodenitrificans]